MAAHVILQERGSPVEPGEPSVAYLSSGSFRTAPLAQSPEREVARGGVRETTVAGRPRTLRLPSALLKAWSTSGGVGWLSLHH